MSPRDRTMATSKMLATLERLGRARERRIRFVPQLTATECGAACLEMVLEYFGRSVSRDELRGRLGAGRDGTTARTLLAVAAEYGLRGRGLRLDLAALASLTPGAILHWRMAHYVILDRAEGTGFRIVDPGFGARFVSREEMSDAFSGVALVFEASVAFERGGRRKRSPVSFVLTLLRESGDWSRIVTTSLFLQLLALGLPLATNLVVDRVLPRSDVHMLAILCTGIGAHLFFQFCAALLRGHLLLNLRGVFETRVSVGLTANLLRLPYAFFQERTTGDLSNRLNSGTVIREILTTGALSTILDGTLVITFVLTLCVLSPTLAAVVVGVGVFQGIVLVRSWGPIRDAEARIVEQRARFESFQLEALSGIETLKAAGAEERALEQWMDLFVDAQNASLDSGRLSALLDAIAATLRVVAPLLVLLAGAQQVLGGALSLGTMLALNALGVAALGPIGSLVSTGLQLRRLGSYLERLDDIRSAAPEQDDARPRARPTLRGAIELERVSFRYGTNGPWTLRDVSLRIEAGQFVAIVGRSGSGKSTLASQLLGLYAPCSGRVLFDGVPLGELDIVSLRAQMGVVTQRSYVFGTTLRSNIALADPDIGHEDVVAAAKLAQIHDDIERMPMGYETLAGNGGATLSGGQRQRVALARALARDPAILLLDEATSALDTVTEQAVNDAVKTLGCTRIVIAHRLSTVMAADMIVVVDAGHIVARGRHHELLAEDGVYRELVAAQLQAPPKAEVGAASAA